MKYPARFVFCFMTLPAFLGAQDIPNAEFRDTAVIPYFQELNPEIVYFQTLYTKDVDQQHTLLLVRGGDPTGGRHPSSPNATYNVWAERDLLGLFLRDTVNPDQVSKLAILPRGESYGSALTVDRADSRSIVLTLTGDYGMREPILKLFYDIDSKQFLGQVRYEPVAIRQIAFLPEASRARLVFAGSFENQPVVAVWDNTSPGPVLVSEGERQEILRHLAENPQQGTVWGSPDGQAGSQIDYWDRSVTLLPIDPPTPDHSVRFFVSFRAAAGARSAEGVVERTADGYKLYPFPQSTLEEHNRLRPERDQQQGRPINWTIEEKIVHYQITDRFWFAKSFYDGEGHSGVGGVGYFDPGRKEYVVFSPPELAPWSASALTVAGNVVWVGLERQPEGAAYSGGLLRFEPATGNSKVYEMKEVIHAISPFVPSASVALGTANGIYVLRNEQLHRFVIEPDLGGSLQIISAAPPE